MARRLVYEQAHLLTAGKELCTFFGLLMRLIVSVWV